jgi:tryptophan synthase alpha chain
MSRIEATFQNLARQGRQALAMYLTVGFPQRDSALELIPAIVTGGADIIELGVPFSDPLADGASVQRATQRALLNGVNVNYCLQTVRDLRARGIETPILFMGYLNPIMQYGIQRFCADAAEAGVDGLIIPDLPPEEADELHTATQVHKIDLIFLLAPTSTEERVRNVVARASGFIYCVSLTGITGARVDLPPDLPAFLARVRAFTTIPLAVGFGISEPRHARMVARHADGVIVGSALLNIVEATAEQGTTAVQGFVAAMREAMDQEPVSTQI